MSARIQDAAPAPGRPPAGPAGRLARNLGVVTALEATTFAVASALHLGLDLPVLGIRGEWFIHAAIPEAVIAAVLAVGALVVLRWPGKAWGTAVGTHIAAALGVLVGISAILGGLGPQAPADLAYHLGILAVLVGTLAVLVSPPGRTALRRSGQPLPGGTGPAAP